MKPWSPLPLALAAAFVAAPLGAIAQGYAPPLADVQATELYKLGHEKRTSVSTLGKKFETGKAEVLVNAPVSDVRASILDYAHYAQVIPKFEKAKVLKKSGQSADVYLQIPIMHGAATIWSVQHFDAPAQSGKLEYVNGRSLQGNVDDLKTRWTWRAVDASHTVLTCEIYVEPRLPVPASTVGKEAQKASAEAVLSVKAHSEAATKKVAGTP